MCFEFRRPDEGASFELVEEGEMKCDACGPALKGFGSFSYWASLIVIWLVSLTVSERKSREAGVSIVFSVCLPGLCIDALLVFHLGLLF